MSSGRPRRWGAAADGPPACGDGALVRLRAAGDWSRALPAAPEGCLLTVSLSAPAGRAAAGLRRLGYLLVELPSSGGAPPAGQATAEILVRQHVIDRHPEWWRSLAGRAERCYNLASGPVQRTLESVLRAHAQALERDRSDAEVRTSDV